MVGRVIAGLVFVGCVVLFALFGAQTAYWQTGNELLQSLDLNGGYERVNAVNREPTYGQRTGPEAGGGPAG